MSSQPLAGKVAIVTGGTRGIGAATVLALAQRGAKVAFTYVSESSEPLAAALVDKAAALNNGSTALAIRADIADASTPERIVQQTAAAFGTTIDILVNNAAVARNAALGAYDLAAYEATYNTNVRGPLFLVQALVPHLPAAGGGRIVNVGSVVARMGVPTNAIYSGTKAALEAVTRAWAIELGPRGHTVNTVAPGATETDMLSQVAENPVMRGVLDKVRAETPMEARLGTAEDVALVVAWLSGDEARWVTGQSISASGGAVMY